MVKHKPVEVIETNIVDPSIKDSGKNIKTVELVQCPKCGKKLTERTLKYSHPSKCSKNEDEQQQTKEATLRTTFEIIKPVISANNQRIMNIKEKQDRIEQLIVNAI